MSFHHCSAYNIKRRYVYYVCTLYKPFECCGIFVKLNTYMMNINNVSIEGQDLLQNFNVNEPWKCSCQFNLGLFQVNPLDTSNAIYLMMKNLSIAYLGIYDFFIFSIYDECERLHFWVNIHKQRDRGIQTIRSVCVCI